jgi:hypothetical protein
MDDFDIQSLNTSRNEWVCRILNILSPLVIEGFTIIYNKAVEMCTSNYERDKKMPTFQNLITRIPKWNQDVVLKETHRILTVSKCFYLEDLITCVHIIQLKTLTAMRVGQKQKKIDINIPKLDLFIHKVYINCGRKIYQNVYLFETDLPPLQIQKNKREIELIVNECILNTIRKNIPVEEILKAYLDESIEEEEVVVESKEEKPISAPSSTTTTEVLIPSSIIEPLPSSSSSSTSDSAPLLEITDLDVIPDVKEKEKEKDVVPALTFSNSDMVRDVDNKDENVIAPKDIESLEKLSEIKETQRKLEESSENDANKIVISSEPLSIDALDISSLDDNNKEKPKDDQPMKLNLNKSSGNEIDLEIIDL